MCEHVRTALLIIVVRVLWSLTMFSGQTSILLMRMTRNNQIRWFSLSLWIKCMYLFVFLTDVKVKLSKCPPSIRGIAPLGAQFFSGSMGNVSFLIITALWTKSFDLMDGIWYIWSLFNRENFLKIMLFSISRSMHVSWSYELKRNRTAFCVFYFFLFFPLFFSFINEMFRCHVFWVNLVCVCPREVRMNAVWRSVRAALLCS